MKYLAYLSIIATAYAGQSFGVVIIRSGSQYQYAELTSKNNDVFAGNVGQEIDYVLNGDGSLVDTKSKKYLNVADNGYFVLSDKSQTGYSIVDDYLAYKGKSAFGVCGSAKVAYDGSCDGYTGVAMSVQGKKDVSDVSLVKSSSTTSTATTKAHSTTTSVTTTKGITTPPATTTQKSTATPVANKKFSLIAIHSGSAFQNAAIKKVDSHPHVFSVGGTEGADLELTFQDDNSSLVDQNARGINLDAATGELGDVAPFGRAPATTGFSIVEGNLAYNGQQTWKACPSGENKFSLSNKDCTGGTGIALKVVYI